MAVSLDRYLEQLDVEKSLKYKTAPVLFLRNGKMLVPKREEFNLVIYEIKAKEGIEEVEFIDEEAFQKLKENVLLSESEEISLTAEAEEEEEELDDTEVSKQLHVIFLTAKRRGASDIHIIPKQDKTSVEFRIAGELEVFRTYPKNYAKFLVNKIKLLSGLDIANSLVPQDGKMKVKLSENEVIEMRVSTIPTVFGEDAVLRLQNPGSFYKFKLENLGFEEEDFRKYSSAYKRPYGLILNVGATGEGKTTTLYLTLQEILKLYKKKRIVTVEDPVEVKFPDIVQVEVDEKQNRTFANVLRAFLRQDPDVILVGEIRDEETAKISVRASLTGHLVLSTLHAIDSLNAITRLKDLGVSPVLIASTVNVILSQRLVRVLCPKCKEKEDIPPELVEKYNLDFYSQYVPRGCEYCNYTGFVGRTAIFEVLLFDDVIKDLVSQGAGEVEIKKVLKERGFNNLWINGLKKVKSGITTLAEVESKIQPDAIINLQEPQSSVDLGVILYPARKVKVVVKENKKEGYVFDVSRRGVSFIFKDTVLLQINKRYAVSVEGEQVTFIPKSYRRFKDGFVVGGTYSGNLNKYFD